MKKKEKLKLKEKEKKRGKRGKEKRRKKRTKRGRVEDDVRVLFLWKPLKFLSQGRDSESCGDVSGEHLSEEPEDPSNCELVSCELVRVVPDESDVVVVPISPSSVVTELCVLSPCRSDWEFVEPQSFSFSQKSVHIGVQTRRKR